jgi:hypothetical protein
MSKIFLRHTLTKKNLTSLSLYIFTIWKCIAYNDIRHISLDIDFFITISLKLKQELLSNKYTCTLMLDLYHYFCKQTFKMIIFPMYPFIKWSEASLLYRAPRPKTFSFCIFWCMLNQSTYSQKNSNFVGYFQLHRLDLKWRGISQLKIRLAVCVHVIHNW